MTRTPLYCLVPLEDGLFGIPALAVTISPSSARWIATVLKNHAQDVREHRG